MTVVTGVGCIGVTAYSKCLWEQREGKSKEVCMSQAWGLGLCTEGKLRKGTGQYFFREVYVCFIPYNLSAIHNTSQRRDGSEGFPKSSISQLEQQSLSFLLSAAVYQGLISAHLWLLPSPVP